MALWVLISFEAVALGGTTEAILFSQTSFGQTQAASSQSRNTARLDRTIQRYCLDCHNDELKTANLSLDRVDLGRVSEQGELWEKVVHKLGTGAMPPADRPQPSQGAREALLSYLTTALDGHAAEKPNPGRPAVYRLNRAEYTNAIRDLLAVEIDGAALLPPDGSDFGFDNIADSLTVSSMSLERYMLAASKIARIALGDPDVKASIQKYEISRILVQDNRLSEDHPFGARGGVSHRHYFPLDGEYVITLAVGRDRAPQQIDVRIDGERIALLKTGVAKKGKGANPLEVRFTARAGTRTIGISFLKKTLAREGVMPSRLPPAGLRGAQTGGGPGLSSFEIAGPYDPTGIGVHRPSREAIFICRPEALGDELACAEEIVSSLARRAFRRPVDADDVMDLMRFYEMGRSEGDFETGIQWVLERILVDPEFLFRVESDPPNIEPSTPYPLSDIELASRLSFFLWSSIPDEELLAIAERGEIHDPDVLEGQVRRMLADERADALVQNFASQWLHLRNVPAVTPDLNLFPEFDDNLREALRRETELFFASQLRQDRSVTELLSADYTFVNERLARHYGIPNVYGGRFRRVQLDDANRHGLLGQGSILTVTSHATRTSPVKRGKWLLENILGSPPPPPPADVPDLPEADEGGELRTMRERMELHRTDPLCASCHLQMDPLGFALENFDGIGKWRTTDEMNLPVDSLGRLPGGQEMDGASGLRDVLLSRSDEFAHTVAQKLLTYALGRGIEYYDQPAIRGILRDAAPYDYRWSSMILGVVKSTPFQMRRSSS